MAVYDYKGTNNLHTSFIIMNSLEVILTYQLGNTAKSLICHCLIVLPYETYRNRCARASKIYVKKFLLLPNRWEGLRHKSPTYPIVPLCLYEDTNKHGHPSVVGIQGYSGQIDN